MDKFYKIISYLVICILIIAVIMFILQLKQWDIQTLTVEKTKCFLITKPTIIKMEFDTTGRLYGVEINGDAALSPEIPCNIEIVP